MKSLVKIKLVLLTITPLFMVGCVDLDQEPQSFLTPDNIILDEANVESLANGLYKDLWHWNYGFNCRSQILGIGADDIQTGSLSKRYAFGDELNFSETNFDQDVEDIYKGFYGLIRSANTMIKSIEPSTDMSEEAKKPYLGEAYFMRAFGYFHLVRYFGPIALFDDPTCSTDIFGKTGNNIERASVADIYDKMIVPSLTKAIEYLPHRSRTKNNASVSKWAAQACLTDVYLTMAGWPLKRTEYFALAKASADTIIINGGYSLKPNYSDLWKEATKSDDTEHIFALNHSALRKIASNYGRSYYVVEESSAAWSDYVGDSTFFNNYPNDKRKEFNYIVSTGTGIRRLPWRRWGIQAPAIAKYRDYGDVSSAQSDGITPIYRYAEVLLMYAEAQVKADGTPNSRAYQAINDVRARATGGVPNDLSGLTSDAFLQAVYDERGWEFFAEFKRWFELVRTERVWQANQGNDRVRIDLAKRGVTAENRNIYLMPLPTKELRLTGWKQNPR